MNSWLKEKRVKEGYTQMLLAKKLNISESYYSLIENEKRGLSVPIAKALGEILNFDWTLLYEKGF